MNSTSLFRVILSIGLLAALPAFAADTTNAAPAPLALDNDDMTKLVAVRTQVLAAHPELKTEEEKLKALHENQNPTAEQKNAAFVEWKAYQKNMRAEMLKIDPTLAPVFTKLDESRKHGTAAPFTPATAK
jgi:hypothetical protein